MTYRTSLVLVIAVLLIGYIALGMASGCGSSPLPAEPTPEQLALVARTHFDTTVGVRANRYPVYSERLVEALQDTGLFDRVAPLESTPDATLVATVDREIYGTAAIPCVALLSLGLIPVIVDEEWGEAFSLRRSDSSDDAVAIDFSYKGPSTLGLWAGVQNLSPNFTSESPRGTDRFHRAFAAAICAHADEILELIGPK